MIMASKSMASINIIKGPNDVPDIAPASVLDDLSVALAGANISSSSPYSQSKATLEESCLGDSTIQAAEPPQTFHPFPRLPTERRYLGSMSSIPYKSHNRIQSVSKYGRSPSQLLDVSTQSQSQSHAASSLAPLRPSHLHFTIQPLPPLQGQIPT